MQKRIMWEKWYDLDEESVDDAIDIDDDQDIDEGQLAENSEIILRMPLNMIRTPLGFYQPEDKMIPSKMFDCWIGHTNFPITSYEENILDNIDGIEALKIMTKYRFFIGVGRFFEFVDVNQSIHKKLLRKDIKHIKYICMFIHPSGFMEHFYFDNEEEYKDQLASLQKLDQEKKGRLIKSELDL